MGRYQLLLKLGWKFELTMKDLLNKLATATAVDFEHATGMPPEIYYSTDFLDFEIEDIFKKEWICIGRTAEIPETGDYLTFELLDQSVIAIRQKDTSIKVFANVCAHRCAKLLEDCGNSGLIVCPYHAFTCDAIWPANWKCFIENYMDAYHIFKVHKDTFGKYGSAEQATTMHDGDDNCTYHLVDIGLQTQNTPDAAIGIAHPDNKHLDGNWRTLTVLGCVFPAPTPTWKETYSISAGIWRDN